MFAASSLVFDCQGSDIVSVSVKKPKIMGILATPPKATSQEIAGLIKGY